MTEEIVIDGINVAGCCNLDEWKHCNICQELIKTIPNRHQCLTEEDLRCEFYPNCNYKQLKRLEQENKQMKCVLEEIKRITEEDRNCMNSELACCQLCDKLDLIKDKINGVLGDEA